MKNYALINGGKVVNVIIADAQFIAESGEAAALPQGGGQWIELTDAHNVKGQRPGPGWTFDGAKFAPGVGA